VALDPYGEEDDPTFDPLSPVMERLKFASESAFETRTLAPSLVEKCQTVSPHLVRAFADITLFQDNAAALGRHLVIIHKISSVAMRAPMKEIDIDFPGPVGLSILDTAQTCFKNSGVADESEAEAIFTGITLVEKQMEAPLVEIASIARHFRGSLLKVFFDRSWGIFEEWLRLKIEDLEKFFNDALQTLYMDNIVGWATATEGVEWEVLVEMARSTICPASEAKRERQAAEMSKKTQALRAAKEDLDMLVTKFGKVAVMPTKIEEDNKTAELSIKVPPL